MLMCERGKTRAEITKEGLKKNEMKQLGLNQTIINLFSCFTHCTDMNAHGS